MNYESWTQEAYESSEQAPLNQGLGGGEIAEVELWSAPVSKSRLCKDMRPIKSTYGSIVSENRFSALSDAEGAYTECK